MDGLITDHLAPRTVAEPSPSPSPVAAPDLSVIIVNYRHWEDTARLVRELREARSFASGAAEAVIVDNHSPRHPVVPWLRRQPGVSLRRWGRNFGFARAVNEGCRLARGQWLLLLNPDVRVPPGFLDAVRDQTQRLERDDPRGGIAGFALVNDDGSSQRSTGPFPTFANTLTRQLLPRPRRKYHLHAPLERCRVPWVTGCCLLVRRDCWEDLNGFDPAFFLYYEDVDLCRRARERGWSVWFEPALQVVHRSPLHSRAVSPALRLVTRHALLTYAAKHWPAWQTRLLAQVVRLEGWWRQRRARRTSNRRAAWVFGQLAQLASDMGRGRLDRARLRLLHVVRGRHAEKPL
jgi:GT2 family glycosyltransferase